MLRETETEETIDFFVTFFSLVAFQWRGAGPLYPLATPMISNLNQQVGYVRLISGRVDRASAT